VLIQNKYQAKTLPEGRHTVKYEELKEITMPSMPLKPTSSIGLHYENELVDFMA
jgi:hypothetical protein